MKSEKTSGIGARTNAPVNEANLPVGNAPAREITANQTSTGQWKPRTRKKLAWTAVLALVSTVTWAGPPQPAPPVEIQQFETVGGTIRSGEEAPGILVKFREGTVHSQREKALAGIAKRVRHFGKANIRANGRRGPKLFDHLVSADIRDDMGLKQALRMLEKNGAVEYVEPNAPVSILGTTPNDLDFSSLWGLNNTGQTGGVQDADIDMPEAWDLATGSQSVVVAVIDTGIDYTHPDLAANMWTNSGEIPGNGIDDDANGVVDDIHGYDFYNDDADPRDDHYHGTHCAGTIGAVGNNGTGVAGVNWSVSLMALKFLGAGGSGYTDDAIAAIQYAINNGAQVLSNSWGGGGYSQALQDAIAGAKAAGLVFIAAAGNNGTDSLVYPAAYRDAVAVSATDHNDSKAGFSSYGAFVDVAAPGVNIYSTNLGGGYRYASGTSMACPHVAGLAALLLSTDPTLSPDQLEAILEDGAEDLGAEGWDTHYGAGRINASQALDTLLQQPMPLPNAVIASPRQGAVVSGAEIEIRGTGAGPGFSDYTLEYALRDGSDWQPIEYQSMPVENGILASWDTSDLADDDYLIRLTVSDGSNRKFYDVVLVTLDNFEARIAFPSDLVSMGTVEILGSAATLNGLPFDSFTLEWGLGTAPSSFSSSGIALAGGGFQPVTDGTLATWDTSSLLDGQSYTLRLTVRSGIGISSANRLITKADQDLAMGWPRIIGFDTQPSIADLDGDGIKEIIVAGKNSAAVHAYRKDGSELPGFPVSPAADIVNFSAEGHAAVADIDDDGSLEIMVGALRQDGQDSSYGLFVIRADGSLYPGWVPPSLAKAPLVPVAADIDGDGSKEIVAIEIARWSLGYSDYRIHAFDLQGGEVPGFPITQSIDDINGFAPYVSVHDLDNDQLPELALLQNDQVLLFDHTGALVPGWPHRVPTLANGDLVWFDGVPTSGDIDGDGYKELVALSSKSCKQLSASSYVCYLGTYATLYAWNKDGSVVPGFPRTTDSDGFVSWMSTAVPLVDIDGDGRAELLSGSDPFKIFDGAGNTVATTSLRSAGPLSVSDVDGDGLFEYASGKSQLRVFTEDGTVLWSRNLSEDIHYAGILLADLEGDGRMELVKAMPGVNPETNRVDSDYYHLYVWELNPGGIAGAEWPMFAQNDLRDGSFNGDTSGGNPNDTLPPVVSITSPEDGASLPADDGNVTIEADATDLQSGIERVEFQVNGSGACTVYAAPYSCPTVLAQGSHTLTATAFDRVGNSQSDTVTVERASSDTTPPTVAIVAPEDGATLPRNGHVTIEADASDTDSGIKRVELAVDGTLVCSLSAPPFVCETQVDPGEHLLAVSAFDHADNRAEAAITVNREGNKGKRGKK